MEKSWRYQLEIEKKLWKLLRFLGLILFLSFLNHPVFAATTHHAGNKQVTKHSKANTHTKKHVASKKRKTKHLSKRHKVKPRINLPNVQAAKEVEAPHSLGFMASIEDKLVNFVHQTVSHLRYSTYKLGGNKFDPAKGIYIVDCSSYVDKVLQNIYPKAYSSLVDWTGTDNPTTHDYYSFFTELPDTAKYNWTKVEDVEELRTGDILVFRYKNASGNETGGHVMIVMDKPVAEDDNFLVRVADSASGGHSEDTRQRHVSGVGMGTLLLKKDPKTYQPSAFAWSVGSRWKKNVNFAMLRPVEIS